MNTIMNTIKKANHKNQARTLITKQPSHLRPGFFGFFMIPLVLIPAAITGLFFGSYGIYKSLHNPTYDLNDKKLVHAAQVAATDIEKQFGSALEIIKKSKSQANVMPELTLEELAQNLSLQGEISEQCNQIKQASEALDYYSYFLEKRVGRNKKNRRKKKLHNVAMHDVLSQIEQLLPEIQNLNNVIAQHAPYFEACKIEHDFSNYYNQIFVCENNPKNKIQQKKQLRRNQKNLANIHKKIAAYPNLQHRLAQLDQHLKTTQDQIEMSLV